MSAHDAPAQDHQRDRFQTGTANIRRVALLTNPAAGKGSAEEAADAARARFAERNIDVISIQGSSPESSRRLAGAMVADPRIDALVVVGGDGLINLALQEQAESDTPLGIIPAGTGNDHAREYHIPLDPVAAASVVADGFWTTTDLGRMRAVDLSSEGQYHVRDTRWFGTIACAGFDSLVSDRANSLTWPKGPQRYNVAIVAEFLRFASTPTRLTLSDTPSDATATDGAAATATAAAPSDAEVITLDATLCAVGNTRSYGGGMLICPEASHHDGLLDITVMGDVSRLSAARNFASIYRGRFTEGPGASTYRARRILIEMDPMHGEVIAGYADGDRFAPLPMELECVPGAGRYIVPRP